jgi:2-polyprenyl-6-methoxyphenol hydroxylase-like FAD-dependent oxidoreductase
MVENSPKFRVLIAGAGIAGLATAIALNRISNVPNLDIQLYEQAPELTEIGASIALSPNVCYILFLQIVCSIEVDRLVGHANSGKARRA